MKKIYLYAGYYELFITDTPLDKPYVLLSWHKSVKAATHKAEKTGDNYYYQQELLPDELSTIIENENTEIYDIQGKKFIITGYTNYKNLIANGEYI